MHISKVISWILHTIHIYSELKRPWSLSAIDFYAYHVNFRWNFLVVFYYRLLLSMLYIVCILVGVSAAAAPLHWLHNLQNCCIVSQKIPNIIFCKGLSNEISFKYFTTNKIISKKGRKSSMAYILYPFIICG